MGQDQGRPQREVKRSATGRVPQWALDEAVGRATTPPPFRALPDGPKRGPKRRARRAGLWGVTGLVLIGLVGASVYFDLPLTSKRDGVAFGRQPLAPQSAPPASPQSPPVGREEAPQRLLPAPTMPSSAEGVTYRFLEHQKGLPTPVTWSPCRPLHFVVRPTGEPAFGQHVIASAVAALQSATGLKIVDDGFTSEAPSQDRELYQPTRYGKRWAPVLISWASAAEVPDFGIDVAGEATPQRISTPSGGRHYVSGVIALDAAKLGSQDSHLAELVLLHELGHLIGLAHVNNRAQVMYPNAQRTLTGYGPGDLAGLAALGNGTCQPDS